MTRYIDRDLKNGSSMSRDEANKIMDDLARARNRSDLATIIAGAVTICSFIAIVGAMIYDMAF